MTREEVEKKLLLISYELVTKEYPKAWYKRLWIKFGMLLDPFYHREMKAVKGPRTCEVCIDDDGNDIPLKLSCFTAMEIYNNVVHKGDERSYEYKTYAILTCPGCGTSVFVDIETLEDIE